MSLPCCFILCSIKNYHIDGVFVGKQKSEHYKSSLILKYKKVKWGVKFLMLMTEYNPEARHHGNGYSKVLDIVFVLSPRVIRMLDKAAIEERDSAVKFCN